MSERGRRLREALQERLLATPSVLPGGALGRLGRTAMTALRIRRLASGSAGHAGEAPDLEALAELVGSVGQLKGIAMKAGQIMGYFDVALPEDVRAALAVLQTASPAMPIERVRAIVREELGARAEPLVAALEPSPVAAASIGQVHRATLPDGRRVAVKVRYPEIEAAIAADFRPASAGTRLASLLYAGADVRGAVDEARQRFLEECDYGHEARSQQRFVQLYAGHSTIRVPEVLPELSARRVLTSGWADGVGFEAYLESDPPQTERDRVGRALFEFYVGTLYRHRLYNCDPHPGNYLFQPGPAVVMLDYGCTRGFEPAFVAALAALGRAARADRRELLHDALVGIGMVRPGKAYDFTTARDFVRGFYGPMLRDEVLAVEPGAARGLSAVLSSKRELMKLSLPGELLFLLRIRFGLLSVLSRLGARANWCRLEQELGEAALAADARASVAGP